MVVAAGSLGSSIHFTVISASRLSLGFTSVLWSPPHHICGTAQETWGHGTWCLALNPALESLVVMTHPTCLGGTTSTAVAESQRSVSWGTPLPGNGWTAVQ